MAPHKFEQDIKNKLDNRKITPSENAWSRLESKLTTIENKKSNSLFWILGIAASIVGILFAIPLFFNNDIEHITPIIVDVETHKKEEIKSSSVDEKTVIAEENFTSAETSESSYNALNKNSKTQMVKSNTRPIEVAVNIFNSQTVLKTENEIALVDNQDEINTNQLTPKEQKINEVLSQIEDLQKKQYTITDADIDKLLNQAQNELKLQTIYNESTKMVDVNKLLQDVEADLDKSFRVKALEALKLNYEHMKNAIAQRNN